MSIIDLWRKLTTKDELCGTCRLPIKKAHDAAAPDVCPMYERFLADMDYTEAAR